MADPSSIINILKSVWDIIKGTRKVKKITPYVLMDKEARKDFMNNNPNATLIYVQGNCYVGDRSQLKKNDKEKLKEIYNPSTETKSRFDIIKPELFSRQLFEQPLNF